MLQKLSIALAQVKMVNCYEGHVIIQDFEHQLEENLINHFLHCSFS